MREDVIQPLVGALETNYRAAASRLALALRAKGVDRMIVRGQFLAGARCDLAALESTCATIRRAIAEEMEERNGVFRKVV